MVKVFELAEGHPNLTKKCVFSEEVLIIQGYQYCPEVRHDNVVDGVR